MCFKKKNKKAKAEESLVNATPLVEEQPTSPQTLQDVQKSFDQDVAAVQKRNEERIERLKQDAETLDEEALDKRISETLEASDRDCDKLLVDFAKRLIDLNKQNKDSKK